MDPVLDIPPGNDNDFLGMIGGSVAMRDLYKVIIHVAKVNVPVIYTLINAKGSALRSSHLPVEMRRYKTYPTVSLCYKKLDFDTVNPGLSKSGGNKSKAARPLGVGRAILYRFIDNINDPLKPARGWISPSFRI